MRIEMLRKIADREEIDYQFLMSALQKYSQPRDKISRWLKSGELIRVKKGLYIFGKDIAITPYSPEILANLIYGPSAVSLNYALSYYGLIPERVETITSVTHKRNKAFTTPIGHFTYHYLPIKKYPMGINLHTTTSGLQFLMASPEKALCDHLEISAKDIKFAHLADIEHYLIEDIRIDEQALKKFNVDQLLELAEISQDKKIKLLHQFLRKIKK